MKRSTTRFYRAVESVSPSNVRRAYDREGAVLLRAAREATELREVAFGDASPSYAVRAVAESISAAHRADVEAALARVRLIEEVRYGYCYRCDHSDETCAYCAEMLAMNTPEALDRARDAFLAAVDRREDAINAATEGL